MLCLGIETSGLEGSLALLQNQVCLSEVRLNHAWRRHAQSLVLEIGELLRIHGFTPQNVEAIAVSRGPGSFTGLRVGMVCAKTFAYATRCRFVAVDTFAVIASNLPDEIHQVHVIEDAQRDDLFAGEYHRNSATDWVHTTPIRIVPAAEFTSERTAHDTVIGPGLKKLAAMNFTPRCNTIAEASSPKASQVAALGERLLESAEGYHDAVSMDYWKASPFYLRMSAAEEKAKLNAENVMTAKGEIT